MASKVTIEGRDGVVATLKAAGSRKTLSRLLDACGAAVAHRARLSARGKGGRSFWASVANSVSYQRQGDDRVVVGASHVAAAQKQYGGVISAPGQGAGSLHRKFLTIPLGPAREGRWDTDEAEAHGYRLFKAKDILFGRLAPRKGSKGRRKGGGAKQPAAVPLFVLKKSVSQKPDPWFPAGNALADAVAEGVRLYRDYWEED